MYCLLLLLPATACADDKNTFSMGSALLQTAWALLVVVGLILAIYGLARKRLLFTKATGGVIRIVEIRALNPRSSLALVEVRGREFLLGVGTSNIHLIAELSPEKEPLPEFETLLKEAQ
ncbi:flagellar biosynthetic protein FliO [Desulfobulbus alkaliphilus]|nr:flagellar biosynthetic protein FliO [Desulfobulbus alkaliphilus]